MQLKPVIGGHLRPSLWLNSVLCSTLAFALGFALAFALASTLAYVLARIELFLQALGPRQVRQGLIALSLDLDLFVREARLSERRSTFPLRLFGAWVVLVMT